MAENHIIENAEVLAHSVAERLCAFLEASERSFVVSSREDRCLGVPLNASPRRRSVRALHGGARTGSGVTIGAYRTMMETAIIRGRALPCFRKTPCPTKKSMRF